MQKRISSSAIKEEVNMTTIVNEFKKSVSGTYEREGLLAAVMWATVLPIFMLAAVLTDAIYNA